MSPDAAPLATWVDGTQANVHGREEVVWGSTDVRHLGDSASLDEAVQDRPLHADVLPELDVVDAALGDEAADEPLAGAQVLADLAGGQSSSA